MGSTPSLTDSAQDLEAGLGPYMAGAMLRQQREALGLDLTDVAAALRIKPAYLEALEAGRPEELPGAVDAIGFIRAFADYLGLATAATCSGLSSRNLCCSRQSPISFFRSPAASAACPGEECCWSR